MRDAVLVFLVLVNVFTSTSLSGQSKTHIYGIVKTTSGVGVADVNVFVSNIDTRNIIKYCLTGQDGTFSLLFNTILDSICINVSGLNINPVKLDCVNRSQRMDIMVEEQAQFINEVFIRPKKIYSKGDTINYNVSSFLSKNDITVAQVLRKLPGVSVSAIGQISYKGQPIKNFYIEGLDLLRGKYGIATNSIDPNNISTIQILENHQDVKALKDLKPEERASINLKLKSGVKGVLNIIATLGGGYDSAALWNKELISTYFMRHCQLLASYKGNNSGCDLEPELRSFSDYDYYRTSNVSDISMPSTPYIEKKYYYFNKSHSATYNNVFRIGNDAEFGVNVAYLNDMDIRKSQSTATTLLPNGTKNVANEMYSGVIKKNMANSIITYMRNSESNYAKEQFRFDFLSSDGRSDIYAGKGILQTNTTKNYRVNNLFHIVRRTGSGSGIDFNSRFNFEKRPHDLLVMPNLFPELLSTDMILQIAERRNVSVENNLDFLSAIVWKNLTIHPSVFFNYYYDVLTSSLTGDYNNNLKLLALNTGVGTIINYRLNKICAELYITGSYDYSRLKGADIKHKCVIEPQLTLKYNIDGTNEIRFVGKIANSNPSIENLYDRFIMTSYRKLSVYEVNNLYQSQTQHYSLFYNYRNIVPMLFFGISIGLTHNHPNVIYDVDYNGIVERITSQSTDETANVLWASLRISKGFDWRSLKIGAECKFSYYKSPILLQNTIVHYNGNSISATFDMNFSPCDWLSLDYGGTYHMLNTRVQGGGSMPVLKRLTNNVSLDFHLPYEISVGTRVSHYYNTLNNANLSFLLGEANISYSYKMWSFTLSCDNLFNKKHYVYSTIGELTESTSIYDIRRRGILLKVRCRIL